MTAPDLATVLDGSARWTLLEADCLAALRGMPDGCADSLVCDPPAGIAFLGADWDSNKGGRTQWIYWLASVLTECRRALKPGAHALVWALPRTAHWTATAVEDAGFEVRDVVVHLQGQGFPKSKALLKPAAEHWILARVPGPTLPLQIEECRIGSTKRVPGSLSKGDSLKAWGERPGRRGLTGNEPGHNPNVGRYPANAVLSHADGCDGACVPDCPVALLDAQSGVTPGGERPGRRAGLGFGSGAGGTSGVREVLDAGTASRFFYCGKAKGAEREGNPHPTAKPLDLMRWLVRLITPPNGLVLDCFAGSGTTLVAALAEGRRAVGIEREAEYATVARSRCQDADRQRSLPLAGVSP